MTYRLAFNSTDSPVLIDQAGRTVAGGDWTAVLTTDSNVQSAIDSRQLVWAETAPNGDLAAEANGRADAFGLLDRDQLSTVARDAGLIGEQDTPTKADLLVLLVPSAVPAPQTSRVSATKTKEQ